MTTNDKHISIYCDGGARGNPGPAACSFIITDENSRKIHEQGFYLGVATNNQAEYQAVIEALKFLSTQHLTSGIQIDFYLDSQLVVNQLNGIFRVKDRVLEMKKMEIVKLTENCKLLAKRGEPGSVNYHHVPRTQNTAADLLVNQTLDIH